MRCHALRDGQWEKIELDVVGSYRPAPRVRIIEFVMPMCESYLVEGGAGLERFSWHEQLEHLEVEWALT